MPPPFYDVRMAVDGIIFDLDGTLIDSNGAHVEAWLHALERFDYRVSEDRIFEEVGKGGDNLVPAILGRKADDKDGDALRKAQPEEFAKIAKAHGLRVLPGARELLAEARRRDLKTALATSGNKKQLKLNEECSGLKISELVDEVTDADDIKSSKPHPDLVVAAASKLKLHPAQCVMVGDTPHDIEASKRGGMVCLAIRAGGHSDQTLRAAGARGVWKDPADLLSHFDNALRISSPAPIHFSQELLERLVREALDVAREGMAAGEIPIGAVLARGDGTVFARGHNSLLASGNRTAHAEIVTFANAAGKISGDARDLILVSSLEPCVMCLGAAMEASIDTIIYSMEAPADSGTQRVKPPQSPEASMPRIVGRILRDEGRKLFKEWMKLPGREPKELEFVKQLLALT